MAAVMAWGQAMAVSPAVLALLKSGKMPKGDVFAAARFAGILAAKRVDGLIPLCHTLKLDFVGVEFRLAKDRILIRARAAAKGRTGVEMEALTAVSVAALTVYDMCKSADKTISIGPIFLAQKSGGRSGTFERTGISREWTGALRSDENRRGSPWL